MQKQIKGKVFLFGKNVDTDQIYPGRFVQYTDVNDIVKYAMHGADEEFVNKVSKGDIIVAGTNFGCGSSREHAAITLKAVGIGVILAESFGRIFYRNAINLGLPVIICPKISDLVQNAEILEVDLEKGVVLNENGKVAMIEPMSEYVLNILENGGIKELIKKQLKENK
ncbi:homoaconitase / isopropylmalate isomerase, small subunit [Arcobacter venerupis]|uniref:3-isopropylmalate dehydratase small subunit n=1 Tax=Arcobacter venerupis TaxID=1054033 RepID=A0AAE7BA38_9BACT|nr:3-isopropylmalate dehydratase small subunit [Arcobacter venerupis]QKF66544.1 homoaconitase / isopropylmalate isomerase, small subunit [Arcobacter venerupis]RWS49717.1 3-isopropylmalate dehydratase [Arcobacter venerupis]